MCFFYDSTTKGTFNVHVSTSLALGPSRWRVTTEILVVLLIGWKRRLFSQAMRYTDTKFNIPGLLGNIVLTRETSSWKQKETVYCFLIYSPFSIIFGKILISSCLAKVITNTTHTEHSILIDQGRWKLLLSSIYVFENLLCLEVLSRDFHSHRVVFVSVNNIIIASVSFKFIHVALSRLQRDPTQTTKSILFSILFNSFRFQHKYSINS